MTIWEYRRMAKSLNQRMRRLERQGTITSEYREVQAALRSVLPDKTNNVPFRFPERIDTLSAPGKANEAILDELKAQAERNEFSMLSDAGKVRKIQSISKAAASRAKYLGAQNVFTEGQTFGKLAKQYERGVPDERRRAFGALFEQFKKKLNVLRASSKEIEETARRFRMYLDSAAKSDLYLNDKEKRELSFTLARAAMTGLFRSGNNAYDSEQIIDTYIDAMLIEKNKSPEESAFSSMAEKWVKMDLTSRSAYGSFEDFFDKTYQKYT